MQFRPLVPTDDVAALGAEVTDGSLAVATSAVRDLTGRAPRTFDQFIAASRPALAAAFGPGSSPGTAIT